VSKPNAIAVLAIAEFMNHIKDTMGYDYVCIIVPRDREIDACSMSSIPPMETIAELAASANTVCVQNGLPPLFELSEGPEDGETLQ